MDTIEMDGPAPKVFFVAPDPAVVTESVLQTAFLAGYEVSVLPGDFNEECRNRVEILLDTYDDVLLVFTLDRPGPDEGWDNYLGGLRARYGERVRVATVFTKSLSLRRSQRVLLNVLAESGAGGRRRRIRMLCPCPSGVQLVSEGVAATLLDLSSSHFAARFGMAAQDWEPGRKCEEVRLKVGHQFLPVRALVTQQRASDAGPVVVFAFHAWGHIPGLDELLRAEVNRLVYRRFQARMEAFLDDRLRARI